MKRYDWILFDADNTLFHFDDKKGLQLMFSRYDVDFSEHDYHQYHAINKPLWELYQKGEITAEQIQNQRFSSWAEKLGQTTLELNNAFLAAMAEICVPLEGAVNLLNTLKGKAKLGMITNGFTALHETRLKHNNLRDHFDLLVVSEAVGFAKPDRRIFDHALSKMGDPAREKVLMVGDTPASDILGGMNSGLDTCWLNTHKKPIPEGITPTYQVTTLVELENLLHEKINIETHQLQFWKQPLSQTQETTSNLTQGVRNATC